MSKDTRRGAAKPEENIVSSVLDDIVREGAVEMLSRMLDIEVNLFLERNQYILDDKGNRLVVRNG